LKNLSLEVRRNLFKVENPVLEGRSDRLEHSAWRIAKKRVNGEHERSQSIIGLLFTSCYALCA
jgi:hypothetical protein